MTSETKLFRHWKVNSKRGHLTIYVIYIPRMENMFCPIEVQLLLSYLLYRIWSTMVSICAHYFKYDVVGSCWKRMHCIMLMDTPTTWCETKVIFFTLILLPTINAMDDIFITIAPWHVWPTLWCRSHMARSCPTLGASWVCQDSYVKHWLIGSQGLTTTRHGPRKPGLGMLCFHRGLPSISPSYVDGVLKDVLLAFGGIFPTH